MQLNQQGFTILETLIAMALSSLVLLGPEAISSAPAGGITTVSERDTARIALATGI
ncbi:prepilin-type N-terminal cleavage/methylation domain-containing protein [Buttiauxella agrestis]